MERILKYLLIVAALGLLPLTVSADTPESEIPVVVKRQEADGALTNISAEDDVVKWLRDAISAGQKRLANELPSILGTRNVEIELVSVPHPEIDSKVNKLFVQWKHDVNPARFIPFVGRAVDNKVDVFVALEARVTAPEGVPLIFRGQARTQTEYKRGIRLSSAFLEVLESAGRTSFEEAIDHVISEAKSSAAGNQRSAAVQQPSS